ncbi:MAG: phosphoglucosamine mutase [Candidatus Krumholzibacteriia bacterium]
MQSQRDFLMASISGIRGIVGAGLNAEVVCRMASAFGTWAPEGAVVIGRDSRVSGPTMRQAVAAGLMSTGHDVIDLGIATTPTTEIMVTTHGASGGVILTASHNPEPWNALKLLNKDGLFLSRQEGEAVLAIEREGRSKHRPWNELGVLTEDSAAAEVHIRSILKQPWLDRDRIAGRRMHAVVDCANGAGGVVVPDLLRRLGLEVTEIHCEPTGRFGRRPEPTPAHLQDLCRKVREMGAHIGFATDPDVDRLGVVTHTGEAIFEEYTLVLAADFLLRHRPGPVVVNLSTTRAMDDVCRRHQVPLHRTPVGEANVVSRMLDVEAVIGGEGNGGVILPSLHAGRDALVGMALILQHVVESGRSLAALYADLPSYRMVKRSIALARPLPDAELLEIASNEFGGPVDSSDGVKVTLPDGWVHLRRSNTEPIVRAIAESTTRKTAEELVDRALRRLGNLSGVRGA